MQPPRDVLAEPDPRHDRTPPDHVPAVGEVVELAGFVGTVQAVDARTFVLVDRRGRERRFTFDARSAWVGERLVQLVAPTPVRRSGPTTTRSGSVAAPRGRAGVARASRIWVEGQHDAELLELVWGDDLRAARVVVEPLHGADDLEAAVAAFAPASDRRLGVLLDHLVPGSKEQRIAARIRDPHVLVTGHPYVDVWAAVRPALVGLERWPDVPRDVPWKQGICAAVGIEEPAVLWRVLRDRVTDWHDLEQPLVHAVEQLLDHVTAEPDASR